MEVMDDSPRLTRLEGQVEHLDGRLGDLEKGQAGLLQAVENQTKRFEALAAEMRDQRNHSRPQWWALTGAVVGVLTLVGMFGGSVLAPINENIDDIEEALSHNEDRWDLYHQFKEEMHYEIGGIHTENRFSIKERDKLRAQIEALEGRVVDEERRSSASAESRRTLKENQNTHYQNHLRGNQ